MGTNNGEKTALGRLVTWFFIALLAIAALKLAFWVFGAALGLGMMLIFRLGPILLVGWLVWKLINYFNRTSSEPNV